MRIVLIIFSMSMFYRIGYNVFYILDDNNMCHYSMEHPEGFAGLESTMYIVTEIIPIMSLYCYHAIELYRRKSSIKSGKHRNLDFDDTTPGNTTTGGNTTGGDYANMSTQEEQIRMSLVRHTPEMKLAMTKNNPS